MWKVYAGHGEAGVCVPILGFPPFRARLGRGRREAYFKSTTHASGTQGRECGAAGDAL